MRCFAVERDTKSPAKANLKLEKTGEVNSEFLNLSIDGEAYTKAKIILTGSDGTNLSFSKNLNSQGKFTDSNLLGKSMVCGNDYTVSVELLDRAQNSSGLSEPLKISSSFCHTFGRGGEGTAENPYLDKNGSDLPAVKMNIRIKYGQSYQISDLDIPAPYLTFIWTKPEEIVDLYGIGIEKNHKIEANVTVEYLTRNEAFDYCSLDRNFFNPFDEKFKCVEKAMNIGNYAVWHFTDVELPCFKLNLYCTNEKYANWKKTEDKGQTQQQVQNVMITFSKQNQADSFISNLWNDDEKGKFKQEFKLKQEVNTDDLIRARVSIFGDFEVENMSINYRGTNSQEAQQNSGLQSGFSNTLIVEKSKFILIGDKIAKVLDVPYFNQYLSKDGIEGEPPFGWQMCGAASSTMIAAYFGKIPWDKSKGDWDAKRFAYRDEGMNLPNKCFKKR
jgi:hypothetical protein